MAYQREEGFYIPVVPWPTGVLGERRKVTPTDLGKPNTRRVGKMQDCLAA